MANGQKQQQQQKIRDKIKSDFPHQKQQIRLPFITTNDNSLNK